jgi:hypothetical protein
MQGHVNRDRKTYKYTLKVLISSGKPQICKKKKRLFLLPRQIHYIRFLLIVYIQQLP